MVVIGVRAGPIEGEFDIAVQKRDRIEGLKEDRGGTEEEQKNAKRMTEEGKKRGRREAEKRQHKDRRRTE